MSESLFEKHLLAFLSENCGLQGEEQKSFDQIVLKLIRHQATGSSCLIVDFQESSLVKKSPIVSSAETGEHLPKTPLVLFENTLYLQKYFVYENRLATQILDYARSDMQLLCEQKIIDKVFDDNLDVGEVNYQKEAAIKALESPFMVVSGGPGTGKTTTVVRILALVHHALNKRLDVALCAPTGKAAQRLYESIEAGVKSLPENLQKNVAQWLPSGAVTIHRLLGARRHSTLFRHNKDNPLGYDIVLVDEASMVDLAMMGKLVDALKPGGRLLLLGDKDQLASVESGTVLSTVVEYLPEYSTQLQKTYRFKGLIKDIATAINTGQGEYAWELLQPACKPAYLEYIDGRYSEYMATIARLKVEDYKSAFEALKKFMVLCGARRGRRAVEGINKAIEERFRVQKIIDPQAEWYPGRPVMINQNDYNLDLYNGDIGICLVDKDGIMRIWFEQGTGQAKSFLPVALSRYDLAYAMTIHKSQGSEFSEVLIVLPEADSQLLCRELIYTGVTRAKDIVSLVAEKDIFVEAVGRVSQRESALGAMIVSEKKRRDTIA